MAVTACSAQLLSYDPDRRVPFYNGQGYERDEYHWFVSNTGQPSRLFLNGSVVSQETGTNDLSLLAAWSIQPSGVPIGIVDLNNSHGQRVADCARLVSNAEVKLPGISRLYAEDVAQAIVKFVDESLKVIVVTTGTGDSSEVLAACRYAEDHQALVVCSVPNSGVNIDQVPDYPSFWAGSVTSVVPVTSTDRNGNLYGPNAAAWGTNVIGAPGRNIVAAGTYATGTSYAAPIAAGCLSLLVARYPGQSSAAYRLALQSSAATALGIRRISPVELLLLPRPVLTATPTGIAVKGLPEWRYFVEYSPDLTEWSTVGVASDQTVIPLRLGFFRLRL